MSGASSPNELPDVWTPKLVRERLVEALRWARYTGRAVGPAPVRTMMPAYKATLEDHLDEGWGLPEVADDDSEIEEARILRLSISAELAQAYIEALGWVATYVAPDQPTAARVLNAWLRCQVLNNGEAFLRQCGRMGVSRGHAYRLRDRALRMIAQGLDRDGSRP